MREDIRKDWEELGEYVKKVRAIPMPEVKVRLCNQLMEDLEVYLDEMQMEVELKTGKDIPF